MEGPPLGPGGEDITWPDQVAPRGRKASSTRKIKPQTSNLLSGTNLRLSGTNLRISGTNLRQSPVNLVRALLLLRFCGNSPLQLGFDWI